MDFADVIKDPEMERLPVLSRWAKECKNATQEPAKGKEKGSA
jgi:hypothetical protein